MNKNRLFYLNFFIIIVILINIIKPIGDLMQWALFPFDYTFSKIQQELLKREENSNNMDDIMKLMKENELKVLKTDLIDFDIPYGLILKDFPDKYIIMSTSKVKKDTIVINTNKKLLGYVKESFGDRIIVKKIGWNEKDIFGEVQNKDVLIKEKMGMIYIELPEDIKIDTKKINIKLPYYLDDSYVELTGEIISKYADFYIFKPNMIESSVVYFLEE
ncbi:hypothetical protein OF820_03260 [Oceanotoga sp. DSM 15011]|jgi:hypothetical protein|nr:MULTISPECIES: hypothetical protein [Oceanotoga]MDN5341876.1 hypothetical protein [Oceanotoga sp.]MDO7976643.1 hypothetical protein [Oceanotoga teriensis]UYP00710.1 hypothetical protein OF820_03260 [Oceanotoga sp. DSM 15011]